MSPALPTLDILESVLSVAKRELLARHPLVADLVEPGSPYDSLDLVARILVGRLDELQDIADIYRRAIDRTFTPDIF